jgi:hypothetical protein
MRGRLSAPETLVANILTAAEELMPERVQF